MPVHPEKADCTVTIADELSLGFAVTVKQNIEDGHIELDDTMAASTREIIRERALFAMELPIFL
ncbi:hypothetical protein HDU84_005884 [Entophlyctis sp. JEL0112]|nr:hypothetical protein HDU84_005884 [Entophlyctis sp. JEL0112]